MMAIKLSITISQKLKEISKSLGKTIVEVRVYSSVNAIKINFYGMDKDVPTISILQKLAKGVNYTIFDIIDERTYIFTLRFVRFIKER